MSYLGRLSVALLVAFPVCAARAQNPIVEDGLFVPVPSPITSSVTALIRNRIEAARNSPTRPVKTVVFDFTPGGKEAVTADFGASYELAKYIRELFELKTVGFLTAGVSGHHILPVLACKEVAVGKQAKLGEIVKPGEVLSDVEKAGYAEALGDPRESLRAVVAKMYDRSLPLGKGQKNGSAYYVDLRQKAALEARGIVVPDATALPGAAAGEAGVFAADRLRSLGLARVSAESRRDLAEIYQLSASSMKDDPLGGRPPVAFRYSMRGPVDGGVREATRRVIQDVQRQKGNILFLVIECSGGELSAARDIADELAKAQEGPEALLVVGFIPEAAPDTAAVIALGCNELVMSRGKGPNGELREATLGDFSSFLSRPNANADAIRTNLRELAARQGYAEVLIDGMLDVDLVIVRAHAANDRTRRRLMSEKELEAEKANWAPEATIKPRGSVLVLTASRAAELGLARFTIDSRDAADVFPLYGLDAAKVKEATPGWLDRFANFLRIPAVTVLLVVIGFAGLVLELKVPGTTVPGIVAALCFIMIFWAHTAVNGNAAILGGMLFLLGLVLILMEIFVIPGFGVPGMLGLLFMIGGIGVATFDRVPSSGSEWFDFGAKIGQYTLALIASIAIAFVIARFLPNIPYANRLMLETPGEGADGDTSPEIPGAAAAVALLGAVGTAATTLRPAGMAQFGDQYVDVVTEGGYIPAGAQVRVVEVEATRIVVKEV